MKKSIVIIASGLIFLFTACENTSPQTTSKVYLHLQSSYHNDAVKISIDGHEVYNRDSVLTMQVLGFADSDSTEQDHGSHTLQVTVNNTLTHTENFTLNDPLWIGINYYTPGDSIVVLYSDEPYIYD